MRLLKDPKIRGRVLDIREYLVAGTVYQGFTRRGIRLANRAEIEILRDVFSEILRDLLM